MTLSPLMSMLGLVMFCVVTETGREICFKQAAATHDGMRAILSPMAGLGIVFWAVELVAWTRVLQIAPLSLAFPLMALSYVTIALSGAIVFNETINLRHALGIVLVTAGVVCVGVTGL
ncbi:EamA family transporter [Rhizobium straminoryzae]|uniref:EamA family transporter n=1 Tax=Rhizobium straminoryzae TaxID=1387186 RepID=A0A549TDV1_9HYPH|nr:EamA family transporter [Rhizobium straminoryzae]TRL40262.1 EamA family transporter [Rhizobium straminoryzae]